MEPRKADVPRNPYSPPVAAVADTDGPLARELPRAVKRAAILMLASFVVSSVIVALEWRHLGAPESPFETLLKQAGALVVTVWLAWKIASGRHWARVVVFVFAVLSAPALFAQAIITAPSAAWIAGLELLELGFDVAVVYLVFFPGHDYFVGGGGSRST